MRLLIVSFLFCLIHLKSQNNEISCRAFTHPLNLNNSVSIYLEPNKYYKEIAPDDEAGWIVDVLKKDNNFFKVDIKDLNLNNIWIHIGDIGVVVQNYDSVELPVYVQPSLESSIVRYLYKSQIGLLFDVTDDFCLLKIITEDRCIWGWVERKYLCGNPYTTCG